LAQVGTQLSNDFDALDYPPAENFRTLPSAVSAVETKNGLVGSTTALIDTNGYVSEITTTGQAPIFSNGLKHDFVSNIMSLSLSKHYQFDSDGTVLYVFATYVYNKAVVPASMTDLQSNRFDIILTKKDGDQVDPDVILFLVDFLFRIKAFHSILRKVIITMLASDTYQVTDYCVGGQVQQAINVDAGLQQTPPEAIIPVAPGDCPHYTPEEYGFRRWDITYRKRILDDLQKEFDAWAELEDNCAASPCGQDRSNEARDEQTELVNAVRSDWDATRNTLCELDGSDYCYLGRPRDRTDYQVILESSETWRFKPCALGMGSGVYYTYPSPGFLGNDVLKEYIENNEIAPKYLSWMGNKYRAYSRTDPHSLHYSNHQGFDASNVKHNWLGIRRPSLNIQHDNLNFPGHRLPTMGALLDDFTHPTWKLKPWDIPILCECNKPRYDNPLNASLEVGSDGSEHLVFDDIPYNIKGNGQLPDIWALGEHRVGSSETTLGSADSVTHAIYGDMTGGHPAITFDGMVQSVGVINVPGAFGSAVTCGTDTSDYSDGYPAATGWLSGSSLGDVSYFPASSNPNKLADELDVPTTESGMQLLFTLSSQIIVEAAAPNYDHYRHHRLDCGCLHLICTDDSNGVDIDGFGTGPISSMITCTVADFLSEYGSADNDQVEYDRRMVLTEAVDASLEGIDDPGSSLFSLNQVLTSDGWQVNANGGEGANPFPPAGSIAYKDAHDTIHEAHWETIDYYLDLITITREPRVWGVSYKTGKLVDKEVYRKGIVTTTRQIFINTDSGWQLVAEASEQTIELYKSTYSCNTPFTDPFSLHLSHNLQDLVGWAVICGSHWTDPSEDSSENVVWTGVSGPGAGNQPLTWIDVFGEHDLTAVCG